jgi:predicted transcriptional regulator
MMQNEAKSSNMFLKQNEAERITLSIRVTREEHEKLMRIAEATESSLSRILRLAVKRFLREWEKADAEDI